MEETKKVIKAKVQFKHEYEVDWLKSSYVPLDGEQVFYDAEIAKEGVMPELPIGRTEYIPYPRVKIGDGVSTVNQLPFVEGEFGQLLEKGIGVGSVQIPNLSEATGEGAVALGGLRYDFFQYKYYWDLTAKLNDASNTTVLGCYYMSAADAVPVAQIEKIGTTKVALDLVDGTTITLLETNYTVSITSPNVTDENEIVAPVVTLTKEDGTTIVFDTEYYSYGGGAKTIARGNQSFAAGGSTLADGPWSAAFGKTTKAYGGGSQVEGGGTQAGYSYEEFKTKKAQELIGKTEEEILALYNSTYKYWYAHAQNESTKAYGRGSDATGKGTIAWADYSHAGGDNSKVYEEGVVSRVDGYDNENWGPYSAIDGYKNKNKSESVFVAGASNNVDDKSKGSFVGGIGNNIKASIYATVSGNSNIVQDSPYSFVAGQSNEVHGKLNPQTNQYIGGSIVTGQKNKIYEGTDNAHVSGYNNNFTGGNSYTFVSGYDNILTGSGNSIIVGNKNTLSCKANSTSNSGNFIVGTNNKTDRSYTVLQGHSLTIDRGDNYQYVRGRFNIPGDYIDVVAYGDNDVPVESDDPTKRRVGRKNLYTLDRKGNAIFAGTVSDKDGKLSTEDKAREIAAEEVAKLVDGAPDTLDTLNELAEALRDNENIVDVLEGAIGNKLDKVLNDINLETELPTVIDKSKWIKEYDFHHLTGNDFDESKLPETFYYEPIDEAWFNTIEGVADPIYDFENVRFTTSATRVVNNETKDNYEFTKLYSYTDEWGNTRYTFNENYHPHADDGEEGEPKEITSTEQDGILYTIKLEAAFKPGTGDVFKLGKGKFAMLSGDNVVVNGDGATVAGQWNMALGNHTSVYGHNNIVRNKNTTAFGYGNVVTGIHAAAINEGNKVIGYASFGWGDNNTIIGEHSTSGGWRNTVYAPYSFVNGVQNIAKGEHIAGFGFINEYDGMYNIGNGSTNTIIGDYNNSNGYKNTVFGSQNNVNGNTNIIGSQLLENGKPVYENGKPVYLLSSSNTVNGLGNEIHRTERVYNKEGKEIISSSGHIINGTNNIIEVNETYRNFIIGANNTITSKDADKIACKGYALISGVGNTVKSTYGVALGEGLDVQGHYGTQLVLGRYNVMDKWANLIIGQGTSDKNRKNVFVVSRDGEGTFASTVTAAEPTKASHLATKQYADKNVDAQAKKIENINETVYAEYIVDETDSYTKKVPLNVGKYARIDKVCGATKNVTEYIKWLSLVTSQVTFDNYQGTVYEGVIEVVSHSTHSFVSTTSTIRKMFPNIEIGKKYIITYDLSTQGSEHASLTGGEIYFDTNFTSEKIMDEEALDDYLYFNGLWVDDPYSGLYGEIPGMYTNIRLKQVHTELCDVKTLRIKSQDPSGEVIDTFYVPQAIQQFENYGKDGYNIEFDENGTAWWISLDKKTDVSRYFSKNNYIQVIPGGKIIIETSSLDYAQSISAPYTIKYYKNNGITKKLSEKADKKIEGYNLFSPINSNRREAESDYGYVEIGEDYISYVSNSQYPPSEWYTETTLGQLLPEAKIGKSYKIIYSDSTHYDLVSTTEIQLFDKNKQYIRTLKSGDEFLLTKQLSESVIYIPGVQYDMWSWMHSYVTDIKVVSIEGLNLEDEVRKCAFPSSEKIERYKHSSNFLNTQDMFVTHTNLNILQNGVIEVRGPYTYRTDKTLRNYCPFFNKGAASNYYLFATIIGDNAQEDSVQLITSDGKMISFSGPVTEEKLDSYIMVSGGGTRFDAEYGDVLLLNSYYLQINAAEKLPYESYYEKQDRIEQLDNLAKLPKIDSNDNGGFLRVVNGEWVIDKIASAEGGEF